MSKIEVKKLELNRTTGSRASACCPCTGTSTWGPTQPLFCWVRVSPCDRASLKGAEAIRLTSMEFRLLHLLLANAGRTLSPERITSHVWGYRGMGDKQLLKQLVHRLRRKIEPDAANPKYVVAVAGVGYALHPTPDGD